MLEIDFVGPHLYYRTFQIKELSKFWTMEERVKGVEKVEHKVENEMSKNKTDNHRKRKIQKKNPYT